MKDSSEAAWKALREMAGDKAPLYAFSHEDGWSREALFQAAYRRLQDAYARLRRAERS